MQQNEDDRNGSTLSIRHLVGDIIVLVLIGTPLLIFHKFVTPYKRGFYCDDESIRYPFVESTVSRQLLGVMGITIPIVLILLTELLRSFVWEKNYDKHFGHYKYGQYVVNRLFVRLYIFIGYFLVGTCFNQLMVDIGKYTIGRHRPHFIDVCKPSVGYTCPPGNHTYITDFVCTNKNVDLVHESQLSFYSGHASFSFYVAWYTSLYLQARVFRPLLSPLILPVIQFLLFYFATFVSYTRVSNYKHHWSDVLVGAIVGSIIGIMNALFVAKVFQRRELPPGHSTQPKFLCDKLTKCDVDIEMGNSNNQNNTHNMPRVL